MRTVYHQRVGERRPKRGDLLYSNVGDKRERTWLILGVHVLPTRFSPEMQITALRTRIWAERWWKIEPELRLALFRSSERAGGQAALKFFRFPARKKPTFEQWMRRSPGRKAEPRIKTAFSNE